MYTIFFISFLTTLALHVSGAICTHHQDHNCSVFVNNTIEILVYHSYHAGIIFWEALCRVDWSTFAGDLEEKRTLLGLLQRVYEETKIFRIVGNYLPVLKT
jgi:hypothetical protein